MAEEIWAGRQAFLSPENRNRYAIKVSGDFVEGNVQRPLTQLRATAGTLPGPAFKAAEQCLLNCQTKINSALYTPELDKSVDNESLTEGSSFSPGR